MSNEKTIPVKNVQGPRRPTFVPAILKPVLFGILIIGGGIWVWHDFVKDRVIPKNFGVVENGLIYRSGRISAGLIKKTLVKYKIGVIVDLVGDKKTDVDQNAEKDAAAELNIKRMILPLGGNGTGDVNNYALAIAAIVEAKRANTPILVHCGIGAQRTGGVIAAYQLLVNQKGVAPVVEELKCYGWKPRNTALTTYLNSNMGRIAELLYQAHVIEQIPSPLPQLPQEQK